MGLSKFVVRRDDFPSDEAPYWECEWRSTVQFICSHLSLSSLTLTINLSSSRGAWDYVRLYPDDCTASEIYQDLYLYLIDALVRHIGMQSAKFFFVHVQYFPWRIYSTPNEYELFLERRIMGPEWDGRRQEKSQVFGSIWDKDDADEVEYDAGTDDYDTEEDYT
ncbi:MAG: hypothetical protein Q9227_008498 [Pyrenula ochraceoflavens]